MQVPYATPSHCPDLPEWPQRWRIEERDLIPGQALLELFAPFLEHLRGTAAARKTLRRHRDNPARRRPHSPPPRSAGAAQTPAP
ncbi:MAG: hypothetical protein IPF50_01210 [Proteobacteria bacterium]|nr:hypothetical protein [Pseudomonadota bacterium]